MNKYKIFAHLVLLLHLLIVLIILVSLPTLFINYKTGLVLSIAAIVAPLSWVINKDRCVFTIWENRLRARYNKQATYSGGCIAHYISQWFGINVTTFQVDVFLWSYLGLVIITIIGLKP